MRLTSTEDWLVREMEQLPVVDAHEHLPVERVRLTEHVDALTFYRQYTRLVMFSAGLDEHTFLRMHDPEVPLDERFGIFDQYRNLIRFSSAARVATIALGKFYGEREVTRETFEPITRRMRELYQPGVLYHAVLEQACNIRAVLQNAPPEQTDFSDPLLRSIPMMGIGGEWHSFTDLAGQIVDGEHGFSTSTSTTVGSGFAGSRRRARWRSNIAATPGVSPTVKPRRRCSSVCVVAIAPWPCATRRTRCTASSSMN